MGGWRGDYNEGGFEAYTPCLGLAESRTKEKRVRSLRDERRVPNDHGSFMRESLFLALVRAAPVLDSQKTELFKIILYTQYTRTYTQRFSLCEEKFLHY